MQFVSISLQQNLEQPIPLIQQEPQSHYLVKQDESNWSFSRLYELKQEMAHLELEPQQILKNYEGYTLLLIETFTHKQEAKRAEDNENQESSLDFNSIRPLDFLKVKTFEQVVEMFEMSDESQGTILDFIILLQYKIYCGYIQTGRICDGMEKIIFYSRAVDDIIKFQTQLLCENPQITETEQQLWNLGLSIWQYQTMTKALNLFQLSRNIMDVNQFHSYQHKLLNIQMRLLQFIEQITKELYGLDFQKVKQLSIFDESLILEQAIKDQNESYIKLSNQDIIKITLDDNMNELYLSYLQTFQDEELRSCFLSITKLIDFYNTQVTNVIKICEELGLLKILFTLKFDLLKLKNIYPKLNFKFTYITDVVSSDCESVSLWKSLYGSILIHKLIYMHKNGFKQQFKKTFQESIQVKEIPGQCFTNLFLEISSKSSHLIKMKENYFGYFESFCISQRKEWDNFQFTISLLKYLSAEPQGQIVITLKARAVGRDRKKVKLQSDKINLHQERKQTITFDQRIPFNQKGQYLIKKVIFLTGKFKLYFHVSQNLKNMKLNFHSITADVIPLSKQQNIGQLETNNLGVPCLIKIQEIPQNSTEIHVEFLGNLHQIYFAKPLDKQTQISSEEKVIKIKRQEPFPINYDFYLQLTVFSSPQQNPTTQIKLVCQNDKYGPQIFSNNIPISIQHECLYKELVGFDGLEENSKIVEIRSISKSELKLIKKSDQFPQEISLMQGQIQKFFLQCQESNEIILQKQALFIQREQKKQLKDFDNQNLLLEYINQPISLDELMKKNPTQMIQGNQSQQILFKINIQSVMPQEQGIPFQQGQFYSLIMKVQFLGQEKDHGDYIFTVFRNGLSKLQIKGERRVSANFSNQQTILLHTYSCFFTGFKDYLQPEISIQKQFEKQTVTIERSNYEVQFQLQMSE